jgi:hypothetical protein
MKDQKPKEFIRDLRQYSKKTNVRLFLGFIFLLIVVGLGLVFIFYGKGAFLTGLLCMVAGLFPILLIFLVFKLIDFVIKKSNS